MKHIIASKASLPRNELNRSVISAHPTIVFFKGRPWITGRMVLFPHRVYPQGFFFFFAANSNPAETISNVTFCFFLTGCVELISINHTYFYTYKCPEHHNEKFLSLQTNKRQWRWWGWWEERQRLHLTGTVWSLPKRPLKVFVHLPKEWWYVTRIE